MEGQWSMFGMDGQSRSGMPDAITTAAPTESDFAVIQHLMDCVPEFPLQDSHSDAVQREEALSLLDDLVTMWTNYQLTLLEKAKKENSIVYLETGSGKTHIAVMLLLHIADVIRKPSTRIALFLCPNVSLVQQQAKVVQQNTNLEVGTYYGEMNIDAWKSETWEAELEKKEALPQRLRLRRWLHNQRCGNLLAGAWVYPHP